MNTRRYPRTMQEAFGPYAGHDLQPMHQPTPWTRFRIFLACAYAIAFLCFLVAVVQ